MGRPMQPATTQPRRQRVDWVDYAKGFCIVIVVMMHSTLGVEDAAGQRRLAARRGGLRQAVPDAGLLPDLRPVPGAASSTATGAPISTARSCISPISTCCGSTIQFAFKAPVFVARARRRWRGAGSISNPSSSRSARSGSSICCRSSSSSPSWRTACASRRSSIWLVAAALEIAHDRDRLDRDRRVRQPLRLFLHRLHVRAAHLRARGARAGAARDGARRARGLGRCSTACWCSTATPTCRSSRWRSALPARRRWSSVSALLAQERPVRAAALLRAELDRHLSRLLPADGGDAASVLLKTGWIADIGTISLLVTVAGVVGALVLFWAVRGTPLRFLFERPERFWIAPKSRAWRCSRRSSRGYPPSRR